MPTMTTSYVISDLPDATIEVRTVPGGRQPDFPVLQIEGVAIYSSPAQLESIMGAIDDYLELTGYYDEFDDTDASSVALTIHAARVDEDELFIAVAAEAVTS